MRLKQVLLLGSLFPFLLAVTLFFGVLVSADNDDSGGDYSSDVTGMNLSAEVLKHQPMVESMPKNTVYLSTSIFYWLSYRWKAAVRQKMLCKVRKVLGYRLIL